MCVLCGLVQALNIVQAAALHCCYAGHCMVHGFHTIRADRRFPQALHS